MGKHRVFKLFAGVPAKAEPQNSWMRDLQLQTVSVDPARWAQGPQPNTLWHPLRPHTRPRRLH